jgi:hypothetical protein
MTWNDAGQIALTLVLLAVAGWRCWRSRGVVPDAPRFFVRVLVPACAMGLTIIVGILLDDEGGSTAFPIAMLAVLLILFCAVAALSILVVELVAWRLRPIRTSRWLAGSFALFAGIFLVVPSLLFLWLDPKAGTSMLAWDLLEWVGILLAIAMLWWSYLPAGRPSFSKVFE